MYKFDDFDTQIQCEEVYDEELYEAMMAYNDSLEDPRYIEEE